MFAHETRLWGGCAVATDTLVDAQGLLRSGRWAIAASAFERLKDSTDATAAFEGLGQALWWLDPPPQIGRAHV